MESESKVIPGIQRLIQAERIAKLRVSPDGLTHGQIMEATNPETGISAAYQWDADKMVYVSTPNHVNTVNKEITSFIEAAHIANQLSKNGSRAWIDPCDKPDWSLKLPRCRYKDLTKGLCGHPDGLITEGTIVQCPRQLGSLKLIGAY